MAGAPRGIGRATSTRPAANGAVASSGSGGMAFKETSSKTECSPDRRSHQQRPPLLAGDPEELFLEFLGAVIRDSIRRTE